VEGEIVGLKVGIDDVGGKDGDADGSTVGKTDGDVDGATVGETDGMKVGTEDDGEEDGKEVVGAREGEVVGE